MEVRIAYTLAPRNTMYINHSIASLRAAWFSERINIFAEPWEYTIDKHEWEVILRVAEEKFWCFKNYHRAVINTLLDDYDWYVMILQDDFIFEPGMRKTVEDFIKKIEEYDWWVDLWYLCLGTPFTYPDIHRYWWNSSSLWRWSRLALYLMHSSTMREMIKHPFYMNHLENYEANKQVDACVSETLLQMGKQMFFHNPSLATHVWEESSVDHFDPYVNMKYHKVILP